MADLPDEINGLPKRKYLFQLDCEHMDWCDAVLLLFDGRVPDEGACFELGYFFQPLSTIYDTIGDPTVLQVPECAIITP